MGIDITYDLGGRDFEIRLTRSDWALIEAVRGHLPREVEILVDVPELGHRVQVPAEELRRAASAVLDFLKAHPDVLPRTYEYKLECLPDRITIHPALDLTSAYGGGEMHGIHMENDPDHCYGLRSGFDECVLIKSRYGSNEVEERDIRGLSELRTKDFGTILIRSKPTRVTIRRTLSNILASLGTKHAHVIKAIS